MTEHNNLNMADKNNQGKKLADSLTVLKKLQDNSIIAIYSDEMSRTHRERLLKNGFIQEVIKGWYIPSRPDEASGETTSWYTSFWDFCASYLHFRFKDEWCLSPEQSISLHVGNFTVPAQLLVRSPKAGNKPTTLLHKTSILDLRLKIPPKNEIENINNLNVMSVTSALCNCSLRHFGKNDVEIKATLASLQNIDGLLHKLLDGQHSSIAGRLAGAFRNIGREKIAIKILETMRTAGYNVTETNPFNKKIISNFAFKKKSAQANRLIILWNTFRKPIEQNFKLNSKKITAKKAFIKKVDTIYLNDAYHSLSIEGYRVNEQLINRVRKGIFDPTKFEEDNQHRNAMAARGYWQAFQEVKKSINKILNSQNAMRIIAKDHDKWYRELFAPSVSAGTIKASYLAGYRNETVFIRKSMYIPPNHKIVSDLMATYFKLLEQEENIAVKIVLGHFFFVYIHPYVDGNGRMARFLMNATLASGGFDWLIIPVEKRITYMKALESASVKQNILPFTKFISGLMKTN